MSTHITVDAPHPLLTSAPLYPPDSRFNSYVQNFTLSQSDSANKESCNIRKVSPLFSKVQSYFLVDFVKQLQKIGELQDQRQMKAQRIKKDHKSKTWLIVAMLEKLDMWFGAFLHGTVHRWRAVHSCIMLKEHQNWADIWRINALRGVWCVTLSGRFRLHAEMEGLFLPLLRSKQDSPLSDSKIVILCFFF